MTCLSHEAQAAIKDLADTYARYRGVIGELSLVRKVADAAYIALRGAQSCEDPVAAVAEAIAGELDRLGVDRSSVRRGELQGLPRDVVEVIRRVFPNIEHYAEKPEIAVAESSAARRGRPLRFAVPTMPRAPLVRRLGPVATLVLVIAASAAALIALSLLVEALIAFS